MRQAIDVLVIGSGGREHTLVWKIAQSPRVGRIFCAPGNAGIAEIAHCVPIKPTDTERLLVFAEEQAIGLCVVGPEQPLCDGLVDRFEHKGLRIFGASKAAARIEGSKVFAKCLMARYDVPTAPFRILDRPDDARAHVRRHGAPIVVKADGLAAGKGALVCRTVEQAEAAIALTMEDKAFGAAGEHIVVEDCLVGEEASALAFVDGDTVLSMAAAQDHKPVYDNDRGPNTGGMGACSPAPIVTGEVTCQVEERIFRPIVRAMAAEGCRYRGVLYAGLMITETGPQVLEFNVRFGDPETQAVLPRLRTDLVDVIDAVLDGRLADVSLEWRPDAAVCVVMASGGYPGHYEKGKPIEGLDEAAAITGVEIFHAGTARRDDRLVTAGGRVLGVTALGPTLPSAIRRAYEAVDRIRFEGAHYRRDIGARAVSRLTVAD